MTNFVGNALICLVVIAVFAADTYLEWRRRKRAIAAAVAEYRIAIDFIAEDFAEMPHEFAAIFLAGNRIAMEQKFPDYFDFRAASLLEALNEDLDTSRTAPDPQEHGA